MTSALHISGWIYKALIVLATVIWGFGFVVMKDAVAVMEPAYLIGFRFFFTGIILIPVFFRRMKRCFTREYFFYGAILGVMNFLGFWVQTIGLAYTTPGKNAFLTATYCVIVPFVYWTVAHRRPSKYNLGAAVLCVIGIGFVSLPDDSLSLGYGDAMTLFCALLFAIHMVYVSKFSVGRDVLVLTTYQFLVGGLCGLAVGAVVEPLPSLSSITPEFVFNMVYLVVFASCIALVIQNIALAHVEPSQAALFLSLESVFGVIFSILFYGERVTFRLLVGFALIFLSIVISETFPLKRRKGMPSKEMPQREISLAGDQPEGFLVLDPPDVVSEAGSENESEQS